MEKWQRGWLERHRAELAAAAEEHGDYLPVSIACYLQEECGYVRDVSDPLYVSIVHSDLSAARKCELLVELLERIDQATAFEDYQAALRQSATTAHLAVTGRGDVDLRQLGQPPLPMAVEKARDCLQMAYSRRTLMLMKRAAASGKAGRCGSLPRRCKTQKLEDMFVDVTVLADEDIVQVFEEPAAAGSANRLSVSSTQRPSSRTRAGSMAHVYQELASSRQAFAMERLFSPPGGDEEAGDPDAWPRRVLVTASAGCGKTSLFTVKLPHDWACCSLWPAFSLLCVVQLRDSAARSAAGTPELLQLSALGLSAAEQAEVVEYVHDAANTHRVCLVFDGLDECNVYDCSLFVQQVLYDQCPCLHGVRVIITSRPCIATTVISRKTGVDRRLEVVGFSPGGVVDFVDKYLDERTATSMKAELTSRPDIASMMTVPIFARLACDLFAKTASLPQCMTEIFESVAVSVLQATASDDRAAFATLQSAPAELRRALLALGAFSMALLRRRQLVFGADELQAAGVGDSGMALGFLVQSEAENARGFLQYRFSHVTMQEFVAACYVESCRLSPSATASLFLEMGTFEGQYNTFWQFVSGLVSTDVAKELAEATLNHHYRPATAAPPLPLASAPRLLTSQMSRHANHGELSSSSQQGGRSTTPSYRGSPVERRQKSGGLFRRGWRALLKPFGRRSRFHFSSNDITLPLLSDTPPSATVRRGRSDPTPFLQLMVFGCFHEHTVQQLKRQQQQQPHQQHQSQQLYGRSVDGGGGGGGGQTDGGASRSLAWDSLERSLAQSGVIFINTKLQLAECRSLGTVLRHHGNAVDKVQLSSCRLGDEGLRQLLPGLAHCTRLRRLHLNANAISSPSNAAALTHVLMSSANALESFDVSANPLGDLGVERISASGLRQCRTLRDLYLHETGLTAHGCAALNTVLLGFACLQSLWLDGNHRLGDAGLASLVAGLQHCSRLAVLHLGWTGLTAACFPTLAAVLPFLPVLGELYLDRNDFSLCDGTAKSVVAARQLGARLEESSAWLLVLPQSACEQIRQPLLEQSHTDGQPRSRLVMYRGSASDASRPRQ